MLLEAVVEKMLESSTNFYLNIEVKNREGPRKYDKYLFPGLQYPRQKETVATDTLFQSIELGRGNTCSQFFVGTASNRWYVYPLTTESHNVSALQDYSRNVGIQSVLKSDNAQSETGDNRAAATLTELCGTKDWTTPFNSKESDVGISCATV
eukprot:13602272-Ditylum_brightwellii.AAC.2